MARLKQALQLRQLAQSLASTNSDEALRPLLVFLALSTLQRARPKLMAALRLSLGQAAVQWIEHPKLRLWTLLANPNLTVDDCSAALLSGLQQTQAWQAALNVDQLHKNQLASEFWNYSARLNNEEELLKKLGNILSQKKHSKLFFWHHFDQLGFVPRSWQAVLRSLQQRGWVVVVSSSGIREQDYEQLTQDGCLISDRQNLGLCLGAYRDFCCLLSDQTTLRDRIHTLVLCNDSTLPIGGDKPFCDLMDSISRDDISSKPTLSGLTDSVETNSYHLQSYCLAVNHSLLISEIWCDFWSMFDPRQDKDSLIQEGEIGLSQWLLQRKVKLDPAFSLGSVLLRAPGIRSELNAHDMRSPKDINLTLMAWKSLLKEGFPLIKKHLLLDPPHTLSGMVPLSELSDHLNGDDELMKGDLERLLKSRFIRS